jgi:hypothetical protein
VDRVDFVQELYVDSDEYRGVLAIADSHREFLMVAEVSAPVLSANQVGRSSADVQNVFLDQARQLLHEVGGPRTGRDGASLRATCWTEGDKTFSGWRTSAAADERSGREPKQL